MYFRLATTISLIMLCSAVHAADLAKVRGKLVDLETLGFYEKIRSAYDRPALAAVSSAASMELRERIMTLVALSQLMNYVECDKHVVVKVETIQRSTDLTVRGSEVVAGYFNENWTVDSCGHGGVFQVVGTSNASQHEHIGVVDISRFNEQTGVQAINTMSF